MFEWLADIYSSYGQFINGVAATLTIIGSIFAILQWRKRRKSTILMDYRRTTFIRNSQFPEIVLSAAGDTGTALVRDSVLLINNSDISLDDGDFLGVPFQLKRNAGTIYSVKQIDLKDSGRLNISYDDNTIDIADLHLPRRRLICIQILHDGCVLEGLESNPKALPELRPIDVTDFDRGPIPDFFGFIIAIVPISFLGSPVIDWLESIEGGSIAERIGFSLIVVICLFALLGIFFVFSMFGVSRLNRLINGQPSGVYDFPEQLK